tara:strand:- start:22 stop:348 length:327 start_codon:yes stop_codon:yes gene_type:complete
MDNFETILLIAPDIAKDALKDIGTTFEKILVDQGGSIIGKEDCGLRNLAYKIKSLKKAYYIFYQINIEGAKIQALKKNISQNEKIIRYLFIKVKTHDELPTKINIGNE